MSPSHRGGSSAKLRAPRRLPADGRGGVYVEYIGLLATVAIVTLPAFLYVGRTLVSVFGSVRDMLLMPFP